MKKIIVTILTIAMVAIGAIFVFGQTTDKPVDGQKRFGKHGKHGKNGNLRQRRETRNAREWNGTYVQTN